MEPQKGDLYIHELTKTTVVVYDLFCDNLGGPVTSVMYRNADYNPDGSFESMNVDTFTSQYTACE